MRTVVDSTLLQERVAKLVQSIGTTTDAAKIFDVDPGYISRLRSGKKHNPNDKILKRLGLIRKVCFIDEEGNKP